MKAVIDLSEVEDQLVNCKPGDTYTLTFTVDAKTDEELTGTAGEVEHVGGGEDYADEEETAPAAERAPSAGARKTPKAILMISK